MKFKKLFLIIISASLLIIAFLINAITKNVDLEGSFVNSIRVICVLGSSLFIYYYISLLHHEKNRTIIQQVAAVAAWTGIFLLAYLVISLLPLKGFKTAELKLFPLDYLTIFFSSVLSVFALIYSLFTFIFLKDLIHYRRKPTTQRNFIILAVLIIAASLSTIGSRPLEQSIYESIFSVFAILFIIVNAFRLSWIAYLTRREKLQTLLYSALGFFGFLAILIILSVSEGWTQKGLLYYSYPVFIFVQLTSIFGVVYYGMTFTSTLFHLPTAEAFDRKQTEISSLHNLSKLINQVFDLKDLSATAARMVNEVIQTSGVWIEVFPFDTPKKTGITSFVNVSKEDIDGTLGDKNALKEVLLISKKYLLVDDVSNDVRIHGSIKEKKISSLLLVPILSHENVIGIIYAAKSITYGFEQDDINVLTGFADQVAIAIENARLIERSFEKERLQRELLLAQEMQKRLLPQTLPTFPCLDMRAVSSPALEVGGDYFDIKLLDDDRVGIIIGDVSGKGIGAAFYMAEVKGIFQSLAGIYQSPKEFLRHANEALSGSIDKRSFISLIYAIIDTRSGEIRVARAGHTPMLHVTSSGSTFVKQRGVGLGLIRGSQFSGKIEEEKIVMKEGDICVFYTDGVTESRAADGEEFGYERLQHIVVENRHRSAEEIKEEVIQQVWSFADAEGYHDDLTVFVVKWIGKS